MFREKLAIFLHYFGEKICDFLENKCHDYFLCIKCRFEFWRKVMLNVIDLM
jgi:hypothetical protein